MTDDQLDPHLDAILRAAGSGLRHYSHEGAKLNMRKAMRAFALDVIRLHDPRQWIPIEEDAEIDPPLDTPLLLGWWQYPAGHAWVAAADWVGSSRGGWRHGSATHWMPLPPPPEPPPVDGIETSPERVEGRPDHRQIEGRQ